MQKFQVALLGLNSLFGRISSLLLKQSNIVKRLCLYDEYNIDSAKDLAIINTSCRVEAFLGKEQLNDAVKDADVVIIGDENFSTPHTAFDLMAPKICDYAKAIASSSPNAIIVVAASPMNILVPLLSEALIDCGSYDCNKVLGATAVDNIRANCILAAHMKANPQKVVLPVIGGSSRETRVPLLSQAKPSVSLPEDTRRNLIKTIKESDTEIFALKKVPEALNKAYTTVQFLNSILAGLRGEMNNVSIAFARTSQVPDVDYFALPVQFGRFGIEQRFGLPKVLSFEKDLINESIIYLKNDIEKAKLFFKSNESVIETCSHNTSKINTKISEQSYFESLNIKEWEQLQEKQTENIAIFKKPAFSNSKLYRTLASLPRNIMIQPWDKPFDTKSFFFKYVQKMTPSLSDKSSKSLMPLNTSKISLFESRNPGQMESKIKRIKADPKLLTSLNNPVELIPNYSSQNLLLDNIQNKVADRMTINENKIEESFIEFPPICKSATLPIDKSGIHNSDTIFSPLFPSNDECGNELKQNKLLHEADVAKDQSPKISRKKSFGSTKNLSPSADCSKLMSYSNHHKNTNTNEYKNNPAKNKFQLDYYGKKTYRPVHLLENSKTKLISDSRNNRCKENTAIKSVYLTNNHFPQKEKVKCKESVANGSSPSYNAFMKQVWENSLKNKIASTKLLLRTKKNYEDNLSKNNQKVLKSNITHKSKELICRKSQSGEINHEKNYCNKSGCTDENSLKEEKCNHCLQDSNLESKEIPGISSPPNLKGKFISKENKQNGSLIAEYPKPAFKQTTLFDKKAHLKWEKLFLGRKLSSNNPPFKDKFMKKNDECFKSRNIFFKTNIEAPCEKNKNLCTFSSLSVDPFQDLMATLDKEVYSDGLFGDSDPITIDNTSSSMPVLPNSKESDNFTDLDVLKKEESSSQFVCDENKDRIHREYLPGINEVEPKISYSGVLKTSKPFCSVKDEHSFKFNHEEVIMNDNNYSIESKKCSSLQSADQNKLSEKFTFNYSEKGMIKQNSSSAEKVVPFHSYSYNSVNSGHTGFMQSLQQKEKSSQFLKLNKKQRSAPKCSECVMKAPQNECTLKINCISKKIAHSAIHCNYSKFQKKKIKSKIPSSKKRINNKLRDSFSKNLPRKIQNDSKMVSSLESVSNKPNFSSHGHKEKKQHNIKFDKKNSSISSTDKGEFVNFKNKELKNKSNVPQALPVASYSYNTVPKANSRHNIQTYMERKNTFKLDIAKQRNKVGKIVNKPSKTLKNLNKEMQTRITSAQKMSPIKKKIEKSDNQAWNNSYDFKPISPTRTFIDKMKNKVSKSSIQSKPSVKTNKHKTPTPPPPQNLLEVIQRHYENKTVQPKNNPTITIKTKLPQREESIPEIKCSEEKHPEFQLRDAQFEKIIIKDYPPVSKLSRSSSMLNNKRSGILNSAMNVENITYINHLQSDSSKENSTISMPKFVRLKLLNEKPALQQNYYSKDLGASACSYLLREKLLKLNRPFYHFELTEPKESEGALSQSKVCEDFSASCNIENLYSQYTKDFITVENSSNRRLPSLSFFRRQNLWSI